MQSKNDIRMKPAGWQVHNNVEMKATVLQKVLTVLRIFPILSLCNIINSKAKFYEYNN